jgi:hypothetical protein
MLTQQAGVVDDAGQFKLGEGRWAMLSTSLTLGITTSVMARFTAEEMFSGSAKWR